MCLDPASMTMALTIGSAAMSAGTAMLQVNQTNQMAQAQADAAHKALDYDYRVLNRRQQEINEKAALEAMDRQRQGIRERSKIMAAMGEAGVLGNSPLREINDSLIQTQWDTGIIEANRQSQIVQTEDMKYGTYANAEGRIEQAKAMAYSPFTSLLKIGMAGVSGGLQGYTAGSQLFQSIGNQVAAASSLGTGTLYPTDFADETGRFFNPADFLRIRYAD